MKYSHNTTAFSIIFALGLTLLLSFMGLYLLEYMIPFSRNIKGVENSSKAFYKSYAGLEDALYSISQGNIGDEFYKDYTPAKAEDFLYKVTASGSVIPQPGTGNSPTDLDYNSISPENSIQLFVGNGRLSNPSRSLDIRIKSPLGSIQSTGTGIILWQLSSENKTFSPDDITTGLNDLIRFSEINDTDIHLLNKQAVDISNTTNPGSLNSFYNSECLLKECVLKLSLINPLISISDLSNIPYLEYQIHIKNTDSIPLRFSLIESKGKSYSFSKNLRIRIPQQTTNSAFDFTVFQ